MHVPLNLKTRILPNKNAIAWSVLLLAPAIAGAASVSDRALLEADQEPGLKLLSALC